MAKATRTKKAIVKSEEKTELPESEIAQPEVTEEPPIEDAPPEEIQEPVTEEPEPEVVLLPVVEETPIYEEKPQQVKGVEILNGNVDVLGVKPDATLEDKIFAFVETSNLHEVKLNYFIKSTYPPVTFAEPAKYFHQEQSRVIRAALQKLVDEGKIAMKNHAYLTLGDYYHEGEDQRTKHHNLNTVEIIAIK